MIQLDGKIKYEYQDNFDIIHDILLGREILVRNLAPKNKKNTKADSFSLFPLKSWYIQTPGLNYNYVLHIYNNNVVKKENLVGLTTIAIDVDIGDTKKCKNKTEFYTRLRLLKKNYWIIPHIIVKSTWGYHLYFNLAQITEYKKYRVVIDGIYKKLSDELLWDNAFERKIWLLKVIGSRDYSNKYDSPEKNIIVIEKVNQHCKYNVQDLHDFYNKFTNNKRTVEYSDKVFENRKEINAEYRYSINNLCPYEITNLLDIYDKNTGCVMLYSESLKKYVPNNSIKIWFDKELWRFCLKEHGNSGKIDLYQIILNHFEWDYDKLREFIYKNFKISAVSKEKNIILSRFIILVILNWNFKIDENKMRQEFWENYKDIIEKTHILNEWKLWYKIIFILLNILSHYDRDFQKSIHIENLSFSDIFSNSKQLRSNSYTKKDEYLKYIKIMKCLYVLVTDFKKDKKEDNYDNALLSRIYLINDFKEEKTNCSIKVLQWMNTLSHKLISIPSYIPRELLSYEEKLAWLLMLFLIKKILNKKDISYREVYNSLNLTYNEKYIRDIKANIKDKFKKIEKYTKKYFSLEFEKDRVVLKKENLKK